METINYTGILINNEKRDLATKIKRTWVFFRIKIYSTSSPVTDAFQKYTVNDPKKYAGTD